MCPVVRATAAEAARSMKTQRNQLHKYAVAEAEHTIQMFVTSDRGCLPHNEDGFLNEADFSPRNKSETGC